MPIDSLRFASLMDMDFAVSGPLVRRSRLVPGFCPSTRTFALRFLQTSPRGDSPCVVANPSPPSGWVEDFHLQATEHAQHTTWARAALRPAAGDLVLLADTSFICEPDFYRVDADRVLTSDCVQARGEAFLKSSIAPAACA